MSDPPPPSSASSGPTPEPPALPVRRSTGNREDAHATQAAPTLPTRTYVAFPPTSSNVPVYAPNTVVPRFIRLLALVVFLVGGSTAAAVTFIYKVRSFPPFLA